MNAPLVLSILIALVYAELAFSHRSKSLSEEKAGEMSDKIKAALQEDADARSFLYRLKFPTRQNSHPPAFVVITKNDDVRPGYRLARREEVKRNKEKVQMLITDKWAIVSFEDGVIYGSGYGWKITNEKGKFGHKLITNIDDCAKDPCEHGTCQDELNDFTCTCDPGWEGKQCHKDIDDCAKDPCEHGTCQDELNDFTCTCDPGWEGKQCHKDIDDCSQNPCKHGTCQDKLNDFICACDAGWKGKTCEQNYGHCSRKTYKEYPCDHGHRVGCLRKGIYKGYCWRSCLQIVTLNFEYIGFEYPRDKAWNYLRCSDPTKGRKADMECIKKGAGTGYGGKACYQD